MDQETMVDLLDDKEMVDKIVEDIQDFIKENAGKKFRLVMLVSDYDEGPWSLVMSADWMDTEREANLIKKWIKRLEKKLEPKEWNTISRVTIMKTTDPFVAALTRRLRLDIGGRIIVGGQLKVNGYDPLNKVVILCSNSNKK